jgi:hypothetical protein
MTYSFTDREQIEEFSNFDLIDEMNEDLEYDDLEEGLPLGTDYDF